MTISFGVHRPRLYLFGQARPNAWRQPDPSPPERICRAGERIHPGGQRHSGGGRRDDVYLNIPVRHGESASGTACVMTALTPVCVRSHAQAGAQCTL